MNYAEYTSMKLDETSLFQSLEFLKGETVSGFYRYSSDENETLLEQTVFTGISQTKIPFLFEAVFYVEGKYSVSIRQYNDFWLFNRVDWKILPPESSSEQDDYLVYEQLLKDRKTKLRFYTQFLSEEQCGFQTLRPAWNAFIGLQKGE